MQARLENFRSRVRARRSSRGSPISSAASENAAASALEDSARRPPRQRSISLLGLRPPLALSLGAATSWTFTETASHFGHPHRHLVRHCGGDEEDGGHPEENHRRPTRNRRPPRPPRKARRPARVARAPGRQYPAWGREPDCGRPPLGPLGRPPGGGGIALPEEEQRRRRNPFARTQGRRPRRCLLGAFFTTFLTTFFAGSGVRSTRPLA